MHPFLKQFQELARTKSADTQSHGCEKGCTKPQSGPKRGAGCSLAQGMSWHIFGTSLAQVSSVANNSREICQIRQIVLCRAVSRETRETRETPRHCSRMASLYNLHQTSFGRVARWEDVGSARHRFRLFRPSGSVVTQWGRSFVNDKLKGQ